MAPLAQGAASPGGSPINVLNEISDINQGLERIKQNLNQLRMLQDRSLNETDSSSGTSRQVDDLSATTMADYRGLVQRVRELKSNRDAQQYKGQVDRVDRALKDTIQQYQQVEADFRRKMQGQMERQYRIVRPEADANEVRAAVEDMSAGGQQVFQQAMMQSNRQGQARAVLNEVQNRHQELLKIEQQMTELAQLIQDLDTLIIQQEPMVQQIDEHVEKTHVDLKEANTELDTAVETVRSTRKKKWICCGIVGRFKSQPRSKSWFFRTIANIALSLQPPLLLLSLSLLSHGTLLLGPVRSLAAAVTISAALNWLLCTSRMLHAPLVARQLQDATLYLLKDLKQLKWRREL